MTKKIAKILFLTMMLILGGIGSKAFAKGLIEVFDGRQYFSDFQEPNDKDKEFFDRLIKDQETNIKANLKEEPPADCKIKPWIQTVVQGSFTKPNSAQKAYLYQLGCSGQSILDNNFGFGLMIAENDKIITNKIFSTDDVGTLKTLPDINKNGLDEFVFIATYRDAFLMPGSSKKWLEIVEFSSSDSFNYLGKATIYWWASRPAKKDNKGIPGYVPWGYKIFVKPSTAPKFFRETYRNIKDEKTKKTEWVLTEKLEEFKLESKKEN